MIISWRIFSNCVAHLMTAWFAFSYLRGYRWLLALSDRSSLALPSISRGGSVVNGHLDHWPAGRLKCPPAFYAPTLTRPSRNSAEILIDTPIYFAFFAGRTRYRWCLDTEGGLGRLPGRRASLVELADHEVVMRIGHMHSQGFNYFEPI